MEDLVDVEVNTPSELLGVVSHLRDEFDYGSWRIDEITRHLCFALLHPEVKVGNLEQYSAAFDELKAWSSTYTAEGLLGLLQQGTVSSQFAAYLEARRKLLEQLSSVTFHRLLAVGEEHGHLLPRTPHSWAKALATSFVPRLFLATKSWIRNVCDVQPHTTDFDDAVHWPQWRGPLLLVMEPSGAIPFVAEQAWERVDGERSLRWLERFAQNVGQSLEAYIRVTSDQMQIEMSVLHSIGKKFEKPPSTPSQIASQPTETRFSHNEDYRSIRFQGEHYALTKAKAAIVRALDRAWESGTPWVHSDKLLAAADAPGSDVRSFFRGSPLWGTLIASNTRGLYRLNLPDVRATE